jgi:hypothetical protein
VGINQTGPYTLHAINLPTDEPWYVPNQESRRSPGSRKTFDSPMLHHGAPPSNQRHLHHPEAHTQRRQINVQTAEMALYEEETKTPEVNPCRPSHKVNNDLVGRAL